MIDLKIKIRAILLLFVLKCFSAFSERPVGRDTAGMFINQLCAGFEENDGQFSDQDGNPLPELLFKGSLANGCVLITTKGLTYFFINEVKVDGDEDDKNNEQEEIKWSRIDMNLTGAVINPKNIVKEALVAPFFLNYYLSSRHEVLNVKTYRKIIVPSIYEGIDWVIFFDSGKNVEYDFIVHPGADPAKIGLKYNGTENIRIGEKGKNISMKNSLGTLSEGNLNSYQYSDSTTKKEINSTYELNNNEVNFQLGGYDHSRDLIIDPPVQLLVWGTSYGGSAADGPWGMITDASGNLYIVGYTFLFSNNFPRLNPAGGAYYQGAFGGGTTGVPYDAFMLKFSNSGVLLWATYYGGTGDERMTDIVESAGDIYVTGFTRSTDFYIQSKVGAYNQSSNAGGGGIDIGDAFVLRFKPSGILDWGTYLGGSSGDIGRAITADGGGNKYLTGYTYSSNFPIKNKASAYNNSSISSSPDIFILKLNSADTIEWSTFYGGSGYEGGNGILNDGSGNLYVYGITGSTDFATLIQTNSYSQSVLGGFTDLFMLKFNSSDALVWSTYMGGSLSDACNDYGYNNPIAKDISGNVYITGYTTSTNFPIVNLAGAYNDNSFNGGSAYGDVFISKFNSTNALVWSSYYGGSDNDIGHDITTDISGNVYVTGYAVSNNFPTQNVCGANYYQSVYGSGAFGRNAFILEFKPSDELFWATYYGKNGVDWGDCVANDQNGCVFFSGETANDNLSGIFINPGGGAYYQPNNGGAAGSDDIFILKFCPTNIDPPAVTVSQSESICSGVSTVLTAGGAITYVWSPNYRLNSSTGSSITATPALPTTYSVIGSVTSCKDTGYVTITVYPSPTITVTKDTIICKGNSVSLMSGGAVSYVWTPNRWLISNTGSAIFSAPSATIIYNVTGTDQNGCVDTAKVKVDVFRISLTDTTVNICYGQSASLTVSSQGNSFSWSPAATLNAATGQLVTATPQVTTVYKINGTYSTCTDTSAITVNVYSLPSFDAGTDVTIFEGSSVVLSPTGNYQYSWSPLAGLDCAVCMNPKANPSSTTMYYVVATDANGCVYTDSVKIIIEIQQEYLYVPSAFTPNGDGLNDIFLVSGKIEASKFHLYIFDRWGLLLFSTNEITKGWDGIYKGIKVQEDVYLWKVETSDKINNSKPYMGRVTLVR